MRYCMHVHFNIQKVSVVTSYIMLHSAVGIHGSSSVSPTHSKMCYTSCGHQLKKMKFLLQGQVTGNIPLYTLYTVPLYYVICNLSYIWWCSMYFPCMGEYGRISTIFHNSWQRWRVNLIFSPDIADGMN